ncbi:MAG: hypothetical protein H7A25_12090 [Leptospiraceae bacterium]|nr:hypothetical protein [Leptospiraceae bacterium]
MKSKVLTTIIMLVFLVSCNKKKKDDLILLLGLAAASQSQAASTPTGTGTTTGTGTGTTTGTGTGTTTGTGTGTTTGTTAPSGLSYSGSPFTFTKNTAITTQTPTVIGTVTSCTSSPSLPAGLSIDSISCALSGTPTASQAATSYTITATNSGGSTTASISITIEGVWAQEAYLKAANAEANDNFGSSVSISSDTLAVGAYKEASNQTTITNGTTASADNSAANSGAVYVFKRSGTTWAQEAYLKAANAEANDNFGISVSVNADTVAVAAHLEDSNQTTITNGTTASADNSASGSGAVYVFKRSGTTWAQEAYLKAANAETGDSFGISVSVNADTVAVGAYKEASNQTTITNGTTASADNSAANSGAVYVFKRSGTTWAQEAYLKAANAEANDNFGISVSVNADTVAVGAQQEDSNQTTITNGTTASADNSAANSGAVYVFKRSGTSWAQEAYLKAPNAEASDFFGRYVSISSDTLAVGAFGEDSNQTTITNGTTASAVNTASSVGAVYVFKRSGTSWTQEAYLKAANAEASDYFGSPVSISSDTLAVGAYQEDSNQTTITNGTTASADNSASGSGAVYVFKRSGTTWAQEAYLKAANAETGDSFGISVSVNADTVAVAAHLEDSNQTTITNGTTASADNSASQAGAVYVFRK